MHQFGFRTNHSTIQQCHRIVNKIKESMEGKTVCISVFLDIQQAFDKVWHKGLLYKLKNNLSDQLYLIMKSYLSERYFQVKINDELSAYHLIRAGVPQGSILGPLLYLIFTSDVPLPENTLMATFADDTAIMSSDHDPNTASQKLHQHLKLLQNWMQQWKITVNPAKST
jgi:retron-type reverse transcriptase